MRACLFLVLLLSMSVWGGRASAQQTAASDREVENLAIFAQTYGYVRFFYPGDEASSVDWDKMAVLGAAAVRSAPNRAALRIALGEFFHSVAPYMRIEEALPSVLAKPEQAGTARVTYWQYQGVKLEEQPNIYSQRRVITGEKMGDRSGLFAPVQVPKEFRKMLVPGVALMMPMALRVDENNNTLGGNIEESQGLQAKLAALDVKTLMTEDWRLRVAGVVSVWNIFQHFHPYLDLIGVNWTEALMQALRRTLNDKTADDYHWTLAELLAKTQDGHGYIYGRTPKGLLPLRFALVEGRVVVTAVADEAPLHKGDVLERIDGVDALEYLREGERYVAGSPQVRRFRTLNQFGQGELGSVVKLEVQSDGEAKAIEIKREKNRRGYFFNRIGEFEFPTFAEVLPGIFYVNLSSMDVTTWEAKLPQLVKARGVIFDQRVDGRTTDETLKYIEVHADVIPHLIDQTVQASPMLVPRITQPDRLGWSYRESTWPVQPKAPRLQGKIVFINEPSVVSYGETCTAMIVNYHLATLVGEPTAGTNGNVNFIPLPGGLRVMWTGMDVRKHDRTSFYGVGFAPDVPGRRTIEGVRQGRDEYLELAIEVIERAASLSVPGTPH